MGVERVLFVLYIEYSHLVLFAKPSFLMMSKTHLEHIDLMLSCKTSGEK